LRPFINSVNKHPTFIIIIHTLRITPFHFSFLSHSYVIDLEMKFLISRQNTQKGLFSIVVSFDWWSFVFAIFSAQFAFPFQFLHHLKIICYPYLCAHKFVIWIISQMHTQAHKVCNKKGKIFGRAFSKGFNSFPIPTILVKEVSFHFSSIWCWAVCCWTTSYVIWYEFFLLF
jgi:hypothetical protein